MFGSVKNGEKMKKQVTVIVILILLTIGLSSCSAIPFIGKTSNTPQPTQTEIQEPQATDQAIENNSEILHYSYTEFMLKAGNEDTPYREFLKMFEEISNEKKILDELIKNIPELLDDTIIVS